MEKSYSDYSSLIFESKWRAKGVINRLIKALAKYKVVSVADLYEIIGPEVMAKKADLHYGWDDLTDAKVIRVNGGFSLDMPEPIDLRCLDGYCIKLPTAQEINETRLAVH